MHLISSSNGPSDSLEDCSAMGSNHATIVSCRVPFKWEEAPGKPINVANTMSSCNNDLLQTSLQLPPKLQYCQGHQTPLFLQQRLHQSSPLSPNHQKLKRLCKYMLKTASWSQPPTHHLPHQSWSGSACAITNDKHVDELPFNERFFFDTRALPKEFKYSVSMDSWKARLPIHDEKYERPDAFVSSEALSFLPIEEHEAESSASSPLQPIMFHERDGSASSWPQPASIKASKELGEDDADNDEDFHDLFSSTASLSLDTKPSQRTDESLESSCPSPSAWFLDFGPKEHEIHEERGPGSKLVVRLVAIIKLKNIISSKVCKLRKRREGANQQENNTSMWSPTLATYLFNQQKEERLQSRSPSLHDHLLAAEDNDHLLASEDEDEDEDDDDDDDDDDDELPSSSSAASSHRFYINPDYHLPTSILRGHLHSNNDISESTGSSSSFRVHQLGLEGSPCFSDEEDENEDEDWLEEAAKEEEEEPHRLSLREQLAEFDDEYPLQFVPTQSTAPPQILDSQNKEPTPRKGMCQVRKTVKVIAATFKLIFVQTEVRKWKGQRPSLKYGSCLKPTLYS